MKFKTAYFALSMFILSGCVNGKEIPERIINSGKTSYFYITSAHEARQAKTITYFYTHSSPSSKIMEYFYLFSKRIGKSHGAIVISPNSNVDLSYTLVSEVSSCEIVEPSLWPVFVFEDREKSKCFPFFVSNTEQGSIIESLSIIEKGMNASSRLDSIQFKHNMKKEINDLIDQHPSFSPIKRVLFEFIEYIGDNLYET